MSLSNQRVRWSNQPVSLPELRGRHRSQGIPLPARCGRMPLLTWSMTIRRLDHVSVVVEDVSHAIDFFTALGMTLEGRAPVEGQVVDRICGLGGIRPTSR